MKLLLIDNYDSFTYNIVELLRQLQVSSFDLIKNDEISIQQASAYDKIIISPGPSTPRESGNILEIIKALGASHSILGICLGHQAVASAYGAVLKNLEHPYHGYQTEIEVVQSHRLFSFSDTKKIKVGLYHSWVVDDAGFPDCLEITSRSNENYIMSIMHKQYDVHGVQFHPESYMTEHGKEIVARFLNGA